MAGKGIVSDVVGHADILVTPNLESGKMLTKQLIHLAGASSAGIALGARVPIMLSSRSNTQDRPSFRIIACIQNEILTRQYIGYRT